MRTTKPSTCHPLLPAVARGMCCRCYSNWRYHNIPGAKKAKMDAVKRWKKKIGWKPAKPEKSPDIPHQFEGCNDYKCNVTLVEWNNLEACLKRRGLARKATPWGGWRKAA